MSSGKTADVVVFDGHVHLAKGIADTRVAIALDQRICKNRETLWIERLILTMDQENNIGRLCDQTTLRPDHGKHLLEVIQSILVGCCRSIDNNKELISGQMYPRIF